MSSKNDFLAVVSSRKVSRSGLQRSSVRLSLLWPSMTEILLLNIVNKFQSIKMKDLFQCCQENQTYLLPILLARSRFILNPIPSGLNKFNSMFHWCQNVSVYNVENHYHFYPDHFPRGPNIGNPIFGRLRPAPISLASGGIRARSTRTCSKKGLNLSKTLENSKNPCPTLNTTLPKTIDKNQVTRSYINSHHREESPKMCSSQIMKTRSHQSEAASINAQSYSRIYKTQQIHQKHKPTMSMQGNQYAKQENNLLLTQLYRTKSRVDPPQCHQNHPSLYTDPSSYTHRSTSTHQIDQLFSNLVDKRAVNLVPEYPNFELRPPEKKGTDQKPNASQDPLKDRTEGQSDLNESGHGYHNSRYNVSRSGSLEYGTNSNSKLYFRILEMSRGQAREASIILSNILSRSGQNSYSYCSNHRANNAITSHDRRLFFEEKQTILSQNDALSEASIKIQESELHELDPHNNFSVVKGKTITINNYTLDLAIENTLRCVVSLKEIGFREMGSISQELQMYEFLQQKLAGSDSYRNVLELYQVQMSNGSYLLIKQPYTHTLAGYISTLGREGANNFGLQFREMIKELLGQFAKHQIYPSRVLATHDFVVCESVAKLHDLSAFRQMKAPMFQTELLLKEFEEPTD